MIALLAACAMRHVPHYEPVAFDLAPYAAELAPLLARDLERERRSGRLTGVRLADGAAVEDLGSLPPEALFATFGTDRRWARGAELDLVVDDRPVTVWWSVDHEARVAWSDAPIEHGPGGVTGADLVRTYGIGGLEDADRSWSDEELGVLALALSLLRPAELEAVDGLTFVRRAASTRSRRELAWYDPTTEPPTISVFDQAFDMDRQGFVGPVDAPIAAGVASVLHEVGHALADLDARRAWQRLSTAPPEEAARAAADYRAIRFRGPRIDAWQRFRDGRPGPSSFGFRDPQESYAEAFALAHVDPDALERALPGAVAFFAADTR